MNPEQFSTLGMYGNRKIFQKRAREGYTEVSFGQGEWVPSDVSFLVAERIVALFSFHHPTSKKIATLQHPKGDDGCHTIRGQIFEKNYKKNDFEKYCAEKKITLGEKIDLTKLLEDWTE